ncbi:MULTISPECIES: hypothetical protein [Burkholderia]|uniref:hypothetical protein n=1 Tax=Burkholderia TaxID=32008 RepID=UPI00075B4228|nr:MULTISPECIES: hypothetical protein [Burkholderia]AOJ69192.1 hypothetical protein WS78_10815 [Burkholderia savannae]KVG39831.1 hypothetical protein WS77_19365 [Burkholderia sp. MSMB0265]KVG85757.1 hypothetical protein WS81_31310 [Burkholderia sp. MSMB2040]KVG92227.1 hypothetical protein WS82_12340 [Burkholderia sp. MSMB2041]KVG95694.1 hypothetical protein WS83_03895 [Burkholderia sp. MSMB2042]
MTNPFKKGDKVRCLKSWGEEGLHITEGRVYEVTKDDKAYVYVTRDNGERDGGYFASSFELAKAEPAEQQISTEFEIRWHRTGATGTARPMSGRVISRRPTQQLAEDFIRDNAGNYAAGEFSITQVTVLKRIQQVRRVKRVPAMTYKLEDA